jgi:GTP-binding protein Era
VEALRFTAEDELALSRARDSGRPIIAVINKIDRVPAKDKLLPFIAELAARHEFVTVVPVSALKPNDTARLLAMIGQHLPESPPLFPADQVTDRGMSFRIAEVIREKLTLELHEELPYGIAVEIEGLGEEDGQLIAAAVIWVDRSGQKPIVIGAGGERLKRIGTQARRELNEMLGRRLHLTLWVKVREDWADNAQALKHLGLE